MIGVTSFPAAHSTTGPAEMPTIEAENLHIHQTESQTISGSSNHLPVVQPKRVPSGTSSFEEKRAALLQAFSSNVPLEYRLSPELIRTPPTDVSGIATSCGVLSPEEIEITENHDATSLVEAIAAQRYTAVAVTRAFCKRAIIAHQLTCCLTQWFMEDAVVHAQRLDDYQAKHGKTMGPLHGLPISIKDHMAIAGTFSSQGCFGSIAKDNDDCDMVAILRRLGAVFYCKTNQPQAIMHLESTSYWGRTLNPFNIQLSAGGSTGGEAALIAMKGSVLGVGTDIGGSIRGPSAFCGIYGFKATSYMLPMRGYFKDTFPAELNVLCSTGPMCRSLRDMDFFMHCILSTKPHLSDPSLVPIPWSGSLTQQGKRLKIGIISDDGFIVPQPPVKRALAWARQILSGSKYQDILEIKEFRVFGAANAWSMIKRMYWPDGGQAVENAIRSTGEPVLPLTDWIIKDAKPSGMRNAHDLSAMRWERNEFRSNFGKSWNDQDVDVVLGPAFVGPACAHDTGFYWTYTSLYNFVDYPGAVFPTPVTAKAAEKYDADYQPLSDACRHVKQLWEDSDVEGAPVNLQLVARKYHDNELFAALKVLQKALNLP